MSDTAQHLRMVEALLFGAAEPLDNKSLAARLPEGADIPALMKELSKRYEARGVNLVKVAGTWAFRTAPDLAFLLEREKTVTRRLSKAAIETLAIVAYQQPVTRVEIEEIRGVSISRGTLDALMEAGWIRLRGRRRTPGRPVTFGTTEEFLDHFNLEGLDALPGLEELKSSGLLRSEPPTSLFPRPSEDAEPEDTEPDAPELDDEDPVARNSEAAEPEQVVDAAPRDPQRERVGAAPAEEGELTKAATLADEYFGDQNTPAEAPREEPGNSADRPLVATSTVPDEAT